MAQKPKFSKYAPVDDTDDLDGVAHISAAGRADPEGSRMERPATIDAVAEPANEPAAAFEDLVRARQLLCNQFHLLDSFGGRVQTRLSLICRRGLLMCKLSSQSPCTPATASHASARNLITM